MLDGLAGGFLAVMAVLNRAVLWILAALIAVMTVAITVQICVRFTATIPALRLSAPWTEEVARYCMIWMIFLGMAVGFRYRMLIAVTYFLEKLPRRSGQVMQYLALAVSFAFLLLLFRLGMQAVEFGRIELSPVLRLPKSWIYWAMPAGAVLSCLNITAGIIESLRRGEDIRRPTASLASEG